MKGRVFGNMPKRGDIVIVTPPGTRTDYIKRVIGLPGDVISMRDGTLSINGVAVKRQALAPEMVPIDINSPCGSSSDPALYDFRVRGGDGKMYCRVPVVRETLPNGRTYETVELGRSPEDNFDPVTIPADHVWLMGDNRDDSADSRVPEWNGGLGGPVPWENIGGRAEFVTFSLDGSSAWWNPISLDSGAALRPRRKVAPEQLMSRPPTVEPHIERPGPAEFRDPVVRREMQRASVWLGMALLLAGVVVLAQPLLLIVGGAIFAVFLDGGVRLLGRYLPIRRGWRLLLVLLLGFGFLGWVIWFAGTTIGAQFEDLREVVTAQLNRLLEFISSLGLMPKSQPPDIGGQLLAESVA